jgi:hypothetical protein
MAHLERPPTANAWPLDITFLDIMKHAMAVLP